MDYESYLKTLSTYKYSISPKGNGIDCHRTWEALYLNCIPIVESNSINELYEDLPVIIIEDWNNITEDIILRKFNEI